MINKSAHDAQKYRTLGGEACRSKPLRLRNGLEGGALKAVLCLQSSTGCLINIDPARSKNSCWRHGAVMFSFKNGFFAGGGSNLSAFQ